MLKRILLAATLLAPVPASADLFTIGYDDSSIDGQSSSFPAPHVLFQTAVTPDQMYVISPFTTTGGFAYAQITTILRTLPDGTFRFDSGFNDGVAPGLGVSGTLTFSWQGAMTAGNVITLPTFFEVSEQQFGGGFTLYEQVYVCSLGQVFCNGAPGSFSGQDVLTGITQLNTTLASIAPGQPFTINEVFTWSMTAFGDGGLPTNVGAGMGTTPIGAVNPVPGPIVGGGVPGLLALLGWLGWRRRTSKRSTT